MANIPKKIVIIGGGFAGVYTAKALLKEIERKHVNAEVCLISAHNYFVFTPLLHEVATGGVSRHNVVHSIHQLLNHGKRFSFLKGAVKNIDTKKKMVVADTFRTNYDIIILATGSKINFFNISGAETNAFPLRTLHDAYMIRNRVISQIELAEETNDLEKRKKLLSFVIVGGGATGVELAGELSEYMNTIITPQYKRVKRQDVSIQLIHRGKEILNMLPEYYSRKCRQQLEKLGVKIHLACDVKEVGKEHVVGCGKHIAGTIFWTAGFKAHTIPMDNENVPQYRVDDYLAVIGKQDMYALGDCAKLEYNPQMIPMLAQVAIKQAPVVTHNVLHTLHAEKTPRVFKLKLDGFLLSVGEYFAVAGFYFGEKTYYCSGFFAWWVWRTIYLSKLIGFGNKVRVAVDWTLNFFYPRDTSEIEC